MGSTGGLLSIFEAEFYREGAAVRVVKGLSHSQAAESYQEESKLGDLMLFFLLFWGSVIRGRVNVVDPKSFFQFWRVKLDQVGGRIMDFKGLFQF